LLLNGLLILIPSRMNIISIAGFAASGKSTFGCFFEKNGYLKIELGDLIRKKWVESQSSLGVFDWTLDSHSKLGKLWSIKYALDTLEALPDIKNITDIVIVGLRMPEQLEYLRESNTCKLVSITSSYDLRLKRLKERTARCDDYLHLSERDEIDVKHWQLDNLMELADFKVINDGTLDNLYGYFPHLNR